MITKERISELKTKYQNEVDYFSKISFPILEGKFREFVKFLDEIEELIKENEKLRDRVAMFEEAAEARREEID